VETVLLINSILLWVVVLFNLLITFRLIQIAAPKVWAENMPKLKTGQFAPPFHLETINGLTVTLSSFKDRPVLLIFFSLQCSACIQKLPEIQAADHMANRIGMQLGLVIDLNQSKAQAFVREFEITVPVFVASRENPIWRQYRVSGIPYYCLIDARARVQETGLLDSRLEMLAKVWKIDYLS